MQHREAFLALPEVVAVAAKAHPQVRAVVNRFALHAAALRMAIAAGLLPWTVEEADAGIVACMGRWVAQRGNVDTAGEVVRAARQVERELVSGLGDRFIHIRRSGNKWMPVSEADEFRQRTPELFDGYVKPDRILVRTEAWRRLLQRCRSRRDRPPFPAARRVDRRRQWRVESRAGDRQGGAVLRAVAGSPNTLTP